MSRSDQPGLVPDWIVAIAMLVGGLWLSFTVAYVMGASGVRLNGNALSFDRDGDDELYEIADGLAFEVWDTWVSVVRTEPGVFPANPVCGRFDTAGMVIGHPNWIADGVVFTDVLGPNDTAAGVELATGALLDRAALEARGLLATKPAAEAPRPGAKPPRDGARAAGAAPPTPRATAAPFDAEQARTDFERVRPVQESCIVYNAAFVFLFLLLGLIAAPVALSRWLRRRRPATG